jgi:hypothetical protein
MTTKHTRGPWHVSKSDHDDCGLLIKPILGQVVAECDPQPEMEANARLIAAAPLLLQALGDLLDLADTDYIDEDNAPIIEAARAALKAATAAEVSYA